MSSNGSESGSAHRDAALMRRIRDGDTEAFRRVLAEQTKPLIKLAYGMTGQLDEAEDIAQESLLSLWQTAAKWEERATIAAYLRTIVTRKAIDAIRKRKAQADDREWEDLYDQGRTPEQELESRQTETMVRTHLAGLSERQRAAIVLTHFENRSHKDAAEIMDMTLEAFSSLLARARRSLRHKIEEIEPGGDGYEQDDTIA